MNKSVLIVMALLWTGQSYGSNQLLEKQLNQNTLEGFDYSKIIRGTETLVMDGDTKSYLYHVYKYIPKTVLTTLGLFTLGSVVVPGAGAWCLASNVVYHIVGYSAVAGYVRGTIQGRTDYENEKTLELLKIAEKNNINIQSDRHLTVEEIASILSKKPYGSELSDDQYVSKHYQDVILARQNSDKPSSGSVKRLLTEFYTTS